LDLDFFVLFFFLLLVEVKEEEEEEEEVEEVEDAFVDGGGAPNIASNSDASISFGDALVM
jgi:hypothetical protein